MKRNDKHLERAKTPYLHQLEVESSDCSLQYRLVDWEGKEFAHSDPSTLTKKKALRMYHSMQFTRFFDERMLATQRQGRISFYLQSLGEEGLVAASAAALEDQDMIMGQYREQAALHYRGFTLNEFVNQLFANHLDNGKGRQMPVHYGSRKLNFMTISSPLATQIPQAAGYAYAQKIEENHACTLCYFGEGASSEGDFHAGLNLAAVLNSPVIFFCRNNGYAISTPSTEQFKGDGIAVRGEGYGIKSILVDGFDPIAVYEATVKARDYAIKHNQPVLIEALSYRLGAHSSSDDPKAYRSKEEEEFYQKHDPILLFKRWLVNKGWLDVERDNQQQVEVKESIKEAVKQAERRSKPHIREFVTDVYQEVPEHLQSELRTLVKHIDKYPDVYTEFVDEAREVIIDSTPINSN